MYFDELPLEDEILDGLDAMNFVECTPVQAETIPVILEGKDVISCAQTGTGKTAAYILPLLNNLLTDNHDPNAVNAIIMAPTRELAQQIDQQMEGFSFYLPFSSVSIYGGNDGAAWETQKRGLTRGADVVIATPGRLLSHMKLYPIDFSKVKYFILDEADRMLDMGFFDDIMTVVKQLPATRQNILFSATMPQELRRLAKTFMHNPVEVNIAVSRPPETILQQAYICYEHQKVALIKHIMATHSSDKHPLNKVILFAGKKQTVKDLTYQLRREKIHARAMHSDLEQRERDEVMLDFRNGKVEVLVATDIVSRGIDIDDIPLVINYDVPKDCEDYVHRIGRTARAENSGEAITLVSEKDQFYFQKIERFLEKEITKLPLPEELGEGPEYTVQEKRSKRRHQRKPTGNNKRNKQGNRRFRPKKQN
ncbi:MAG: DEAD/DEAH box helicase [Bacteroidales bacterium]|nr:DEAD/DEAH box helicase [Bacteroidales bacterium]